MNQPELHVIDGGGGTSKATIRRRKRKLKAKRTRTAGQFVAALAASFLPIASAELAHVEVVEDTKLWCLVAAALMFSLPSVTAWAKTWTGSFYKALGFAVLLEGVLVFAHTAWVSDCALVMLVMINAVAAWNKARGK